ncbi:hypothetical protein AX766_08190 [Flavobacterium covae]|nr:hypothetical protein AWN65_11715 [Flavobacterium covae]AND64392.1 hypothetical protein AX766_08190 [Flavobacterium covae]OWP80300.1 hypothetical protein BWK63_11685 [Flavobacterium covae]OWP87458.1 hypothetical protein BWK60_03490 [Flavobacterium covae]POR23251.1 hypothetical protein BWK57_02515 [Flavobacterium columnare]
MIFLKVFLIAKKVAFAASIDICCSNTKITNVLNWGGREGVNLGKPYWFVICLKITSFFVNI